MQFPKDLRYTRQHEWIRLQGDEATVGITEFAQESLGDVVHVELPEVGASLEAGAAAAEVESVKAVSEVYCPVAGEVVAVNEALDGAEEALNQDPYGAGWLYRVRVADPAEVQALMDSEAYAAFVAEQEH